LPSFLPKFSASLRRWIKRTLFGRKKDGFVYHEGNGTNLS